MKLSAGFDASRLRGKGPGKWRWRLCGALAALLCCLGVLLLMAGIAMGLGQLPPLLQGHASLAVILAGSLLLVLGIACWRICRRRRRRNGLGMAPGLLKSR
ncbi:hypothetical protein [Pseudomonas sp. N040]|uniref:hypothetical protein n=1 Tax=Pseudomonas sp. N040 TaxID=2785325 RepID=UPI0018A331B4|nr:hypothetical protein [Pseudomonas sp. N040]MBF7731411.1 hypothetical protein [Pseudomonas sp. N040]MBW7015055.1 hypothetical protein [Pseudomonas sp. N040]